MGAAGIIGLCSIALAAGCGCLLGVWAAGIVQTSAQKAKGLKLQKDTKAHFIIQSVSRPFLPFAERIAKRDEFLVMHQEALMVFSVFQNVGVIYQNEWELSANFPSKSSNFASSIHLSFAMH